jgi:hypothetical protein
MTQQDHAVITTADSPTITETLKEPTQSDSPSMVDTSSKPSSRVGIIVIFVGFIIFAAVFAWLWRSNSFAHLLSNGMKARYSLISDDPLK